MSWVQTFTGHAFSPLNPQTSTINIEDISHSLGMICRFNGHTREFYSVAEHCVLMSDLVRPEIALYALMHDAAEAYIADVARPIKPHLGAYRDIEKGIMTAIYNRFGLEYIPEIESEIKEVDLRMLVTERLQLLTIHAPEWDSLRGVEPFDIKIECWCPSMASTIFRTRYEELSENRFRNNPISETSPGDPYAN